MQTAREYPARLARVIDGDTYELDLDLGLGIIRAGVPVRLPDIDTPEVHGPTKAAGLAAAAFARNWIERATPPAGQWPLIFQPSTVAGHVDQSFARIVGDVIRASDRVRLADELLDAGHARQLHR